MDVTGPLANRLTYQHYVVAALDLLGQKELLDSLPDLEPGNQIDVSDLVKALRRTVGAVNGLRKSVHDYFSEFSKERALPKELPENFHDQFRQLRRHDIKIFAFSDTVVAWVPVNISSVPECISTMNGIHALLNSIATIVPLFLKARCPIRGAVELGAGIPLEPGGNEIYGKILNSTVKLEQNLADYPRVVVGKGLLDFLNHIRDVDATNSFLELAKMKAQMCQDLLVKDQDDVTIIHYLGKAMRDIMRMGYLPIETYHKKVNLEAFHFVKSERQKHRRLSKLRKKYSKLFRYFNKYLPDWS